MTVVNAVRLDRDAKTADCPCGATISLPSQDGPILHAGGEVWYPTLVAVRCPDCQAEVRLDSGK